MTFLIAEMCQNHMGSRDVLEKMMVAAAGSGATHVKIQGLYSYELVFRKEFEHDGDSGINRPFDAEKARLSQLDLAPEDESFFVQKAQQLGVVPMITVFTHHGLERAIDAGFESFKIASYDCASIELISRVLPVAKELVISTGATAWSEVEKTVAFVKQFAMEKTTVAFLHARTEYPNKIENIGLERMVALARMGVQFGFSDHSEPEISGLFASKAALVLGATWIERHFTIMERELTKDGKVSIGPNELALLADFARLPLPQQLAELDSTIHLSFSSRSLDLSAAEEQNASYYRGRVASLSAGSLVHSWEKWPKQKPN